MNDLTGLLIVVVLVLAGLWLALNIMGRLR